MPRAPRTQKALIELYRVAIDEYRFEVKLNWDRMQYYAVVNSGIIAVGTSLLRDASSPAVILLSAMMFLVGLIMSVIGIVATHKGREYYQATVLKKTIYEQLLGLNNLVPGMGHPNATLAVGTTGGQQEVVRILAGQVSTTFLKRLIRNRIVSYFIWLLILLAFVDSAGIVYAVWRVSELNHKPVQTSIPPSGITVTGPGTVILNPLSGEPPRIIKTPAKGAKGQPH